MDEWKKVIQWADEQTNLEKRKEREHFKRTLRAWPIILFATLSFGGLAFYTLDVTRGVVLTIAALVVSTLIAEHLVQ